MFNMARRWEHKIFSLDKNKTSGKIEAGLVPL